LIASAAMAFVVVLLLRGHAHGVLLDVLVLQAVNRAFAAGPLLPLQFTITDQELPEIIIAACAVGAWFTPRRNRTLRNVVLLAFSAAVATYIVARIVQHFGHRMRPLLEVPMQPLMDPTTMSGVRSMFTTMGSFPSDHTALLAIAVVAAFTVSRRVALALLVFALWAGLYRVAMGYHWPSDVVAGALLGTLVTIGVLRVRAAAEPALRRAQLVFRRWPAVAYAIAFFFLVDFSQSFPLTKTLAKALFGARLFH